MNKKLIFFVILIFVFGCAYFALGGTRAISIGGPAGSEAPKTSTISGENCGANAGRRPVTVMLESDPEGRPLSGIGQADLVVEMPVTPNGITRFMAVYQCQTPKEIGAIRSARQDFIPLAASFQSIYAHWGGEHGALDELNSHIMDDINALEFDGTVFTRKPGIAAPHNGFTTLASLFEQAQKFGYDLSKNFAGYPHTTVEPTKNLSNVANTISLDYPGYKGLDEVVWNYDAASGLYKRNRGGSPEIDKNTNQQVTAKVVAVLDTTSHILRSGDQYVVVNTTGEGAAKIYQAGAVITGTWKKDPSKLDSKLYFYDSNGNEIKFLPGQIWVEWNPTWSGGL